MGIVVDGGFEISVYQEASINVDNFYSVGYGRVFPKIKSDLTINYNHRTTIMAVSKISI
jgi:hypothetical protein